MSHDPALVERCAEAAYMANQSFNDVITRTEPWGTLPAYWRRIFTAQAKAILDIALPQPDPTPVHDPGDYDTNLFGGAA